VSEEVKAIARRANPCDLVPRSEQGRVIEEFLLRVLAAADKARKKAASGLRHDPDGQVYGQFLHWTHVHAGIKWALALNRQSEGPSRGAHRRELDA
jgi:hypothetical protein